MAKKRTKGARVGSQKPAAPPPEPPGLTYKVVELSTVDEGSLEHTVNEWVNRGWQLDGVQFAMRESSKRPSMAFVFFTMVGSAMVRAEASELDSSPVERIAAGVLREEMNPVTTSVRDAWARLRELATDGEDEA